MGDAARRESILAGLERGELDLGLEGEPLPDTLEGCHALIRELREALRPLDAEAVALVAARLNLSLQQAALVLALARAKGRPLTVGQLDIRIPYMTSEHRHASFVRVLVHAVRQRLGSWSVLVLYPYGYALDVDLAVQVRRIAP